jgi:TolB-like protein
MESFWREMRRRHVLRVAGIYVAAGWIFVEVMANLLPLFEAPLWIGKTFTLLLFLAFPITLIIAWAFEITPDGIKHADELEDTGEALPAALPDYLIVAALCLVVVVSFVDFGGEKVQPFAVTDAQSVDSLAVLPFVDFSEGASNQYLADGIAETVLNALTHQDGLRVASRTSSFSAQNQEQSIQEIGQRLGVAQVLEGSLRRSGNRLRVSAQLTNVETGYQTWSQTYDREFDDIFEIEEDLARSIVLALKGPLALAEVKQVVASGTDSVEAYNLNLQGLYAFQSPSQRNFASAMRAFQSAIELDPNYWDAHGYLAFCVGYFSIYSDYASQVMPAAVSMELALRNKPDNVPANLIKGVLTAGYDAKYEYYARALEGVSDRDLAIYVYHAAYLAPQWRHAEIEQIVVDALRDAPNSVLLLFTVAMNASRAGEFDKALELANRPGQSDGSNFLVSAMLTDIYFRMGDGENLRRVAEQSIAAIGPQNGFITGFLLQAHILSGDIDEAETLLNSMIAKRNAGASMSATPIAMGLAGLGRIDESVIWFMRAYRERDYWLEWHILSAARAFPELAAHPTFQNVLKLLGLDEASIQERIAEGR